MFLKWVIHAHHHKLPAPTALRNLSFRKSCVPESKEILLSNTSLAWTQHWANNHSWIHPNSKSAWISSTTHKIGTHPHSPVANKNNSHQNNKNQPRTTSWTELTINSGKLNLVSFVLMNVSVRIVRVEDISARIKALSLSYPKARYTKMILLRNSQLLLKLSLLRSMISLMAHIS